MNRDSSEGFELSRRLPDSSEDKVRGCCRSANDAETGGAAIEKLDRLTDFLNKSLGVAEAKADALHPTRTEFGLSGVLKSMVDPYEPSMSERGLRVRMCSEGPVRVCADAALLHRMVAILLDNDLKHLPVASSITIEVRADNENASLVFKDDGPGFDSEVL